MLLMALWLRASAQDARDLPYYINTGIANSPLLKDLQHQAAANGVDSARLHANYRPQVSGVSNNAWYPVANDWGYDANLSNIAAFNEQVVVTQSFAGKKNLSNQYTAYSLLTDSLSIAGQLSEQDLKKTITAQYIVVYGDLLQLKFYNDVHHLLSNQELLLKTLTESNVYRQTDYLTFAVTLKQQELQIRQLQLQYRNDFYTLNYLCGIFDTAIVQLAAPVLEFVTLPDRNQSAFFRRFTNNNALLENQVKMIDFSYHPKVNAFANAGYSSTFMYDAYKNFGAGAGINLSVPIYDGHQKQLLKKKLELQQSTNENYKEFFSNQYDAQLAMLHAQIAGNDALVADINEQIRYAQTLIEVNEKLLQTGDAKIADFVIAINNYLNAKNLLTQNNITRLQLINQVNYWSR